MGKHDRHRAASQEKDWDHRSAANMGDGPHENVPEGEANPGGDFEEDAESAGLPSSFAREIKIGLAALGTLLLVLVVVVWSRVRQTEETPSPEKVAGAQPPDTQSPAAETSTSSAKGPREVTATEPKQPLLPPRQASASTGQARGFGSESGGPGPANPFGSQGGPSFMPKVAKAAGSAGPPVAGGDRPGSPFAAHDSLPPEPPGDEVTVGEGPADPFRNKGSGLAGAAKPNPFSAPAGPADAGRPPPSGGALPAMAGSADGMPNPLRGTAPSPGGGADRSGPWGTAPNVAAIAQDGGLSPAQQRSASGAAPVAASPSPEVARASSAPVAPRRTPGRTFPVASTGVPAGPGLAGSTRRVYIVREGDTLYDIARNELGKASRWGEIYDLNWDQLGNRVDGLVPGMKLLLPDDAGQPAGMLSRNPQPPGTPSTLQR